MFNFSASCLSLDQYLSDKNSQPQANLLSFLILMNYITITVQMWQVFNSMTTISNILIYWLISDINWFSFKHSPAIKLKNSLHSYEHHKSKIQRYKKSQVDNSITCKFDFKVIYFSSLYTTNTTGEGGVETGAFPRISVPSIE